MNVFEKDGPIKCDECSSTFATTGGLAIHRGWKHRSPEKTAKAALHELTKKKEPKKKPSFGIGYDPETLDVAISWIDGRDQEIYDMKQRMDCFKALYDDLLEKYAATKGKG